MMSDIMVFLIYLIALMAFAYPLGKYMAAIFDLGKQSLFDGVFRPIERWVYQLTGVNDLEEMNWRKYASAVGLFNFFGFALVFVIQISQSWLPFNPQQLGGVASWHLAFNTAVSFMTNTNWQAYAGETTLSYFTQMAALTVQNFVYKQ